MNSSNSIIRDLHLVALPMTAGNDVLFPGCNQPLTVDCVTSQRVMNEIVNLDPPEFAYITLNAWGDPSTVGTIALIEDMKYSPSEDSTLICSGISRFRVLHLTNEMTRARVQIFNDDIPAGSRVDSIIDLEQRLVAAMKDIVTLTIKISDDDDQTRQHALEETLKRVEAFCGEDNGESSTHWIMQLGPNLRRELLSFLIIDMLSVSFMDRRSILESTDTAKRLELALEGLDPFVRELAAKGAIVRALGRNNSNSSEDSSPS